METDTQPPTAEEKRAPTPTSPVAQDAGMDVDEPSAKKEEESNSSSKKEESVPMQADDDDAVEY